MGISWKDGLSTGLEWQDEQHKRLLEQLGALIEAMERSAGASVIQELLTFLDDYAATHLVEEEQYMERQGDPSLEQHRRMHDTFRANLAKLHALYERQGASTLTVLHTQRWLRDWLIDHIIHMDRQMRRTQMPS